jgi:PAS domain S-box-containing protein
MRSASGTLARESGVIRLRRLQHGVTLLGAVVILAFATSSAYDAWRSYRYALVATDREIGNMAKALAEQTAWTLRTVDLLLLDTARWYENVPNGTSDAAVDAALGARVAGVTPVSQMMIVAADGQQLHRARVLPVPLLNVADRSYYIAQRDSTSDQLFISEPLVARTDGRTAVVLSRRFEDASHRFGGVVTARVDLDDLSQLYRAVNIDGGTAIALIQDDGTLLARNPRTAPAVGGRFPSLATAPDGPFARLADPLDGSTSFIAVAPIRSTHLKIAVTRNAAVALQPWREETERVGLRTLILSLLGALTLAMLVRQLGRVAAGERALRESEERYALAMEGANEGHWDWDIRSDRLFLSPRMKVLGGLPADSDVASRGEWRSRTQMHPDDQPRFEAAMREHFEGRSERFECEYRVRPPRGDWRWLLTRGRCLYGPAGEPTRFVGSAIDITEHKQSQLDKEKLESQLRQSQKMEAIGTLAGGIAHDFNNILGAIMGYSELALQHCAENSDLRRYLDNVMHATERAKRLVERILAFSRSGLGNQVQFNVQAVVAETLELLAASLPEGIQLQKNLAADTAGVNGDPTDLHQITMNLCTNAIQAMHGGGVLGVTLVRSELTETRMLARGALSPGAYVRLIVSDTGNGIPPAIMERIFDPFFTTKGVGQGTGLGLSLVHGIVNDLGGAIDVASTTGEGTRFDVWLPVAAEMPMPTREPSQTLPVGRGQTVMIVDDEPALVALAEESIAQLGYEPVGFDSSVAALRAYREAPDRFDAVVTDESMPELSGTELAHEIRRLRPSIPIILMSGHGSLELAQRGTQIGINELLLKPVHSRNLAESLARVFGSLS